VKRCYLQERHGLSQDDARVQFPVVIVSQAKAAVSCGLETLILEHF
jgi:hypothetical protein